MMSFGTVFANSVSSPFRTSFRIHFANSLTDFCAPVREESSSLLITSPLVSTHVETVATLGYTHSVVLRG
jgi:hypothetical protein